MKKFNIHDWQAKQLHKEQLGPRMRNPRPTGPSEPGSFDARLAQQMGMSDDEFEDEIASRDIGDGGSSFPGTDEMSNGYKAAVALKDELREITYKKLSQEEIDTFSKEMVLHFLEGNTTAQAAAKIYFGKKAL